MTAFYIPTGHYVVVLTKWSLSAECVVQHDSLDITNIPQPASERDANEQKHGCHDNTQSYSTVCIMRSHEICSFHCASKKKAYKRGYVYWYKHMIVKITWDTFSSYTMLLHVFSMYIQCVRVNVCTVRVCVCTVYACASVCVLVSVQMYSHCSCKPYMLVGLFNHMTHPEHRDQDSWSNTHTAAQ